MARADCCYVGRGSRETKSGRKEANQGAEVKRRSPFAHDWPLSCPPQQQPSARKAWCSGETLTVLTDAVAACGGVPPPESGPASLSTRVGCSGTCGTTSRLPVSRDVGGGMGSYYVRTHATLCSDAHVWAAQPARRSGAA